MIEKLNIAYIGNYMLEDIFLVRNNKNIFSQAGNNKMRLISKALRDNNCEVNFISNGWKNSKTFKKYESFRSKEDSNLYYTTIVDVPILNLLYAIISGYKTIKRLHKNQKIDIIIFYNFRPETAIVAYLAKRLLKIPIIVEYEDGYKEVYSDKKIKRFIFSMIEQIVMEKINGAILINSKVTSYFKCPYVIVRGIIDENILLRQEKHVKTNHDKPILFYGGGLDEERGIDILLNAVEYCDSDFILQITGRGQLENKIKESQNKKIQYLGYMNYDDMMSKMIEADILVNPQLELHHFGEVSFPSKLYEYTATKNMIVSSNVSDVEIAMGDIVIIYKHDDANKLADALNIALNKLNDKTYLEQRTSFIEEFLKLNSTVEVGKSIIEKVIKPVLYEKGKK